MKLKPEAFKLILLQSAIQPWGEPLTLYINGSP